MPDRIDGIAPVPAREGEALPGGDRAPGIEGELNGDEDRQDRREDIDPGDQHQEAGPAPGIGGPLAQPLQPRARRCSAALEGDLRHGLTLVPQPLTTAPPAGPWRPYTCSRP